MPKIVIDNREVEVPAGATILDAAAKLGIAIPTLCLLHGHPAATSCMVCVVKVNGRERLFPACATKAADGMIVDSETEEVRQARRTAFELLLSDHIGDCDAPCRAACPAHMNIPLMIRQIAANKLGDAIATVKRHIPLPAVLGRICSAPCERACRRAAKDKPLSVCLLKRYAADVDLESEIPHMPGRTQRSRKKVAIVGAGPAGLAAAYYLQQFGHACTIFDDHPRAGGMLRYGVGEDRLPHEVLDAEIKTIEQLGAELRMGVRIGKDVPLAELRQKSDAVLLAAGKLDAALAQALGIELAGKGVAAGRHTMQTGTAGVFAAGDAIAPARVAVRAVAEGRAAAIAISQFVAGTPATGEVKPFSVHAGKLTDDELARFSSGASRETRVEPGGGAAAGFTPKEAHREALRCLRCDCRKADACRLREHAQEYGARAGAHKGGRRTFEQDASHPLVIYEPGKCIACGICVRITAQAGEKLGLTFIGRGFRVRTTVPFGASIAEGLEKVARECVNACPTGALAFKDGALAAESHGKNRKD